MSSCHHRFLVLQVYDLSNQFLPKEWIMAKWEEGFYITAMAGSTSGSSLVVMSKGTPYTQQSYKVSENATGVSRAALVLCHHMWYDLVMSYMQALGVTW